MSLNFLHKPNYFLYAQRITHHVELYLKKYPNNTKTQFDLNEIYQLFQQDLASTTTNLDGIMNIADEYRVETLSGDQKLIQSYYIDANQNILSLQLNAEAIESIHQGKKIIAPDATLHE